MVKTVQSVARGTTIGNTDEAILCSDFVGGDWVRICSSVKGYSDNESGT